MGSDSEEQILTDVPFANQGLGLGYALTGMLGIVGNVLVFRTFWRERRSWLHLQLSIANIITLASVAMSAPSALKGEWLFTPGLCTWTGFQVFLGGYAEMTFTSLICIETFLAVCQHNRYSKFSTKHFSIVSVCVWAYSLLLAGLPLLGYNRYKKDASGSSCGIDLRRYTDHNRAYVNLVLGLTSFVTLAGVICIVLTCLKKPALDTYSYEPLFNDKQITKVSLLLMVFMVVCSIPYGYRTVWFVLKKDSNWRFVGVEFSHLAVKFGCCIQPLAYFLSSPQFKGHAVATVTGVTYEKKNN